jgi:tRNA nucleotidyltransferase (CCA-adding enzyme)
MHDLGKGKTPPETLPHHYGHEAISEHLADRVSKQYKVPKSAARMARLVARYHTHCHKAFELKPATVMRLLESVDAFRRSDSLDTFLLACEADARGRTGFEQREYPQAGYLKDCFTAASRVDARAVLQTRELRGKALGEEIRKQRIRAIQSIKSDYVSDST